MDKTIINKGKVLGLEKTLASNPNGVEYENLMNILNKEDKPIREDLRKAKKNYSLDTIDNSNSTDKLTKETIIPVPGLLVNYEDSQQGTVPRPTDGPFIPSGGLQWGGGF